MRSPNQPHHGLISPSMKNQLSLEVAPRSRWDVSHNKSYYINSNLISHIDCKIEYDARKKITVIYIKNLFCIFNISTQFTFNFFEVYIWVHSDMYGYIQICLDNLRYIQMCSDTFEYVWIHLDRSDMCRYI